MASGYSSTPGGYTACSEWFAYMKIRLTFSHHYDGPLRAGCFWMAVLGVLSGMTLDMGELVAFWRYSAAVFVLIGLLILARRPDAPTTADLLVLKWGFPLLYFCTQLVYPLVWH